MTLFWSWCVRNPALVVAAAGLLAGSLGVIGWPPALMTVAASTLVAYVAQRLLRGFRKRARRAMRATEAERAAQLIRERYREVHGSRRDVA